MIVSDEKKSLGLVISGINYIYDANGFIKQKDPKPFEYSLDYKSHQSTNTAMVWLRLGWLSSILPFSKMKTMNAVDIGAGNGSFVREAASVFKRIVPYDLAGESIDDIELYETNWDLIVLSDVLEHYKDINDLWGLNFKYAMISFPETPDENKYDLSRWRHFKPNEHIYLLRLSQVIPWINEHGCTVEKFGNPEDMIRKRWDENMPNISTVLIKKDM